MMMAAGTELQQQLLDQERHQHARIDPHGRTAGLPDVILGGQDGLVNVLGIILGVAVASGDPRLVLTAGLAAALAESVSMGAVAYTSTLAQADFYESERSREFRHIQLYPNHEKEEVRLIYQAKGFEGELLDQIVSKITADPETWVTVMLAEKHRLSPVDRGKAVVSAVVVGFSALIGSLIPLAPFLVLELPASVWAALAVSALTLFGVGVYKAQVTTVGRPARSGLEMAVIGTISALIGYAIGLLLKV